MATVAPPSSEAADLLQKLSLDTQSKGLDVSEPAKKLTLNPGDVANGQNQAFDRSLTPVLPEFMDPNMVYMPNYASYYYGGYDGTGNDWDDYSRYMNQDGVDMSQGVYGENGSVMYHGYGYAPYAPYTPSGSPVPTVGHDGQLYGAQQYQYPAPYFQPMNPTSGPYPTPAAPPKGEKTTGAGDKPTLAMETANVNSNGVKNVGAVKANNGSAPQKTFQNSSKNNNGSFGRGLLPGGVPTSTYQDPRFGYDSLGSPIPWMDVPVYSDYSRPMTNASIKPSISSGNGIQSRNQNTRSHSHFMGLQTPRPLSGMNTNGYLNRIYPNKMYNQYTNTYRSGYGYGSGGYDSRTGGRGWLTVDNKYKPRGRGNGLYGYGNENLDGLNELNRGPRAKSSKNQKGFAPIVLDVKGQNVPVAGTNDDVEKEKLSVDNDREQYNRADFPETYADAKFYIIKSYSEDDVHKSIKYSVWASTQNGNKKLDAAYQEAQQKSGGCPIFLLFSVNTSGQFVGIAEMLGPVDFNKSLEYWQQDKWVGCFPVKWHIVKDVPNSMLKHITLENNENKPVTNSRDTQEVKLEQGLQLLKIFKEYSSKQSILDDFDFYEDRQKRIQEKKAKQQQFHKQVWEGKPTDEKNKDGSDAEATVPNSIDATPELVKDPTPAVQTNGDFKVSDNSIAVKGEVAKASKPVASTEKKVIPNGVANGLGFR